MKYALLSSMMFLLSCSASENASPEEIIKANFYEYAKDKLNDSSSYEFVSLSKVDTSYWSESESKAITTNVMAFGERPEYMDSLKVVFDRRKANNEIDHFKCELSFRAANAMGAKVLNKYSLVLSPSYEILGVSK